LLQRVSVPVGSREQLLQRVSVPVGSQEQLLQRVSVPVGSQELPAANQVGAMLTRRSA